DRVIDLFDLLKTPRRNEVFRDGRDRNLAVIDEFKLLDIGLGYDHGPFLAVLLDQSTTLVLDISVDHEHGGQGNHQGQCKRASVHLKRPPSRETDPIPYFPMLTRPSTCHIAVIFSGDYFTIAQEPGEAME